MLNLFTCFVLNRNLSNFSLLQPLFFFIYFFCLSIHVSQLLWNIFSNIYQFSEFLRKLSTTARIVLRFWCNLTPDSTVTPTGLCYHCHILMMFHVTWILHSLSGSRCYPVWSSHCQTKLFHVSGFYFQKHISLIDSGWTSVSLYVRKPNNSQHFLN